MFPYTPDVPCQKRQQHHCEKCLLPTIWHTTKHPQHQRSPNHQTRFHPTNAEQKTTRGYTRPSNCPQTPRHNSNNCVSHGVQSAPIDQHAAYHTNHSPRHQLAHHVQLPNTTAMHKNVRPQKPQPWPKS